MVKYTTENPAYESQWKFWLGVACVLAAFYVALSFIY